MSFLKALSPFRRGPSPDPAAGAAPWAAPSVRCRHCGAPRLKLSYRRLDRSGPAHDDPSRTTYILRCGSCEGFTTVSE